MAELAPNPSPSSSDRMVLLAASCVNHILNESDGQEVLQQFVSWATHPQNGFIAPKAQISTLPPRVEQMLTKFITDFEATQSRQKETPPKQHQPVDVNRRQFLWRSLKGAVRGAAGTIALREVYRVAVKPHEPSSVSMQKRINAGVLGGTVGLVLANVTQDTRNNFDEAYLIRNRVVGSVKPPHLPAKKVLDLDDLTYWVARWLDSVSKSIERQSSHIEPKTRGR